MQIKRALLTVNEAMMLTGLARSSIYKAIDSGALPSRLETGRRRRITVADLERFVGAPLLAENRASADALELPAQLRRPTRVAA